MNRYIFDLDNTLVFTDSLNNESYNYALNQLGLAKINDHKRITRDIILSKYPEVSNSQKNEIIELKQKYFVNNLSETSPNTVVLQFLKDQNIEFCILWTSADEARVIATLEYYKINNRFKKVYFSSKKEVIKDIQKICEILECDYECLFFFEDNQRVIQELQQLKLNIIPVT